MVTQMLAGSPLSFRAVPATEFTTAQGRTEAAFIHYLHQKKWAKYHFYNCQVRVDYLRSGTDGYYPDVVFRDESSLCLDCPSWGGVAHLASAFR